MKRSWASNSVFKIHSRCPLHVDRTVWGLFNVATISDERSDLCTNGFDCEVWQENGYCARVTPCGLVYLDPKPPDDTSEWMLEKHADGYYAIPAKLRLQWVKDFHRSGRLLEVGCGRGHFLALARHEGFEVAGIDPDAKSVQYALERYGITVERSTIEESQLPEQSFDVVYHVDLLSHFPDPIRALRSMAARVRPGGYVCFEVGLTGGASPAWYQWEGHLGFPEHRWLYSESALRSLLQHAGLQLVCLQKFGLLADLLLLRFRSLIWPLLKLCGISDPRQRPAEAQESRLYLLYAWLQFILRYRIGRFLPHVGPHTAFVAARPVPQLHLR